MCQLFSVVKRELFFAKKDSKEKSPELATLLPPSHHQHITIMKIAI